MAVVFTRDRLIVGLDGSSPEGARDIVAHLNGSASVFKIGQPLFFQGGMSVASAIIMQGKRIVLDLKLFDEAEEMARAVESAAHSGVSFLTIHGYPATMRAAANAKSKFGGDIKLLSVPLLVGYDDVDLAEAGYAMDADDLIAQRAKQALDSGMDGIVCSATHASPLRAILGNEMILMSSADHFVAQPTTNRRYNLTRDVTETIDYLTVTDAIVKSADPKAAFETILQEIIAASSS